MGKEEDAIYLIRMAADMSKRYYDKPFVCTYSGGKDSDVVLELCKRAGVPFVVQHSITTVDAPQTMRHVISWSDADVWDFIRGNEIEYNTLYDCGYHRVGCVGCPMAGKRRWKEFADFPGFKEKYIKAFSEMIDKMRASGKNPRWKTGEDVFLWWMEDDNVLGQMSFDDFPEMLP